jgi:hypothetical protein
VSVAAASNAEGGAAPAVNSYAVDVREAPGWTVAIVDPAGRDAFVRACRDEAEARTFASTVRQHVAWLSQERFREIYRLDAGT